LAHILVLSFFSPNLSGRRLDVYHTSTHGVAAWASANLECRSEMCCTWLARKTGCKKSPKIRHLGTIAQLCRAVDSQLRHVSTIGKNLSKSSTCSTCPHNMANFSPLMAKIGSGVRGIPANFNRFHVLASVLQRLRLAEANQTDV